MSILHIKPNDESVRIFYEGHSTFHEGNAGLDLFFPEDVTINPGEVKKVNLKISCEMIEESIVDIETLKRYLIHDDEPVKSELKSFKNILFTKKNVSYYLYTRSSISDTPLILANSVGIIDSNYRGSLKAALKNTGLEPYTINRGERLLQICSGNLKPFKFQLVDNLSETTRGSGSFGSTGR